MKLSDELLHVCQALLYSKWSEAYDNLKAVKEDTDDGSPDWALFHAEQLKNNTAEKEKYQRLLNEINIHAPLTRK